MGNSNNDELIKIKIAETKDFFDLNLCAKEFIDFISDFKKKFLDKKFFVLTAWYNNILAGILVSQDKSNKIDSLNKIIPSMYLHFLYVNPQFRKKHIGKKLLEEFITIQKNKGKASIYIKLPQQFKRGIKFFLYNQFRQIRKEGNKVVLEIKLWNDFGVTDCQIIGADFSNTFGID